MEIHLIAQNLGYFISFSALAVKDILWLRNLLVIAQSLNLYYSYSTHNMYSSFWHALFIAINSLNIVRIIRERRPVPIPNELQDIHKNQFHAFSPREFLNFWQIGTASSFVKQSIIKDGSFPDSVSVVLSGSVHIRKKQITLNTLSRGRFIGEMSYLSHEAASAEVYADDQVDILSWPHHKLTQLQKLQPQLIQKFHSILGHELAHKIRETSEKLDH